MYETPEELQAKISEYFSDGVTKRKVVVGRADNQHIEEIPVPTITGLILYCGFADRHSFYDYEKRPLFSHTIKRARTFIEKEYEEFLNNGGGAAAIFALKNFGWKDERLLSLSDDTKTTAEKMKGFAVEEDELEPQDDIHDDSPEPAAEATE